MRWANASGGTTFTTSKFFSFTVSGVYFANSTWVVYGSNGNLETSTDGLTWTARTTGFGSQRIDSLVYANNIWVAVGTNGTISTSPDLVTWTLRTSNMSTNVIYTVKYLNSNFVAVGAGANGGTGGITTSTDGITWTRQTTPGTTNPSTLWDVNFGNGYYVAVGNTNGSNNAGYYSTNLTTWTGGISCGGQNAFAAFYSNGRWIIYTDNGIAPRSRATDPLGTFIALNENAFYNFQVNSPANFFKLRNDIIYSTSTLYPYIMGTDTNITSGNFFRGYTLPILVPTNQQQSNWTSGNPFDIAKVYDFDSNGKIFVVTSGQNRGYIQG